MPPCTGAWAPCCEAIAAATSASAWAHWPAGAMDFAAWMEVWLGDRWWTFDPRNNVRRKGRTVIGRGRDASDVAMATTYGGPTLHQMTVTAHEIGADR